MRRPTSALWATAMMVVLVPANIAAQLTEPAAPNSTLFEIRVAQDDEGPGMQRMESSGEVFFVGEGAIVNDSHIEFLRATRSATGLTLNIQLTEEGATRIRQASRSQIGKRLGILINSRLITAPIVRSPLDMPDRRATIGLTLPENEAESVAATFEARFDQGLR